jgi:hypothetical protein
MNWTKATREALARLEEGTVCWVFGVTGAQAAVWTKGEFRVHRQEHFSVPDVKRFIILPTK